MKKLVISITAMAFLMSAASTTVYVTKSGKKYHTHSDCRALKNSATVKTTTLEQVTKDGKELCTWCYNKDNKKK